MKVKSNPNWQERQKILDSKDKKYDLQRLKTLGELALKNGYLQDALEYFRNAKDQKGLDHLKNQAVEEGDVFLFMTIEKTIDPFDAELWNKIGNRAFELGKYRFARTAFEHTENESMLAKLTSQTEKEDVSQTS